MSKARKTFSHFSEVVAEVLDKTAKEGGSRNKSHRDDDVEAHSIFRSAPGHKSHHHNDRDQDKQSKSDSSDNGWCMPGITEPGATGVIYVMDRASANGFSYDDPEWANFGQGAPEVGPIPNASERPTSIDIKAMGDGVNEYAPTTGVKELRTAIADLYNDLYRQGKESKYTHENVCIVPGGRAGLIRVAAVIGECYVAYQIPEYTAYSSMLSIFRRLVPVPTSLSPDDKYKLHIDDLQKNIHSMGISVIVLSNPRNPTGQVIRGKDLEDLVQMARDGTSVILDEFYSFYNYEDEDGKESCDGSSVSAAAYVEDVNKDPVVLINGLTKSWRLPGWRCCWVIGPKTLINALGQSGSYLDGGCSHPTQLAAVPLLEPKRVKQDMIALQKCFKDKRNFVLKRLEDMGLKVNVPPTSTFYIWLDVSCLPEPLNSGLTFFEELLKEKVITVPGIFFDINPSHRRNVSDSPCNHFVRLSFGPPMEELSRGLDGIQRLVDRARQHYSEHSGDLTKAMGKGYKRSEDEHRTRGRTEASSAGS